MRRSFRLLVTGWLALLLLASALPARADGIIVVPCATTTPFPGEPSDPGGCPATPCPPKPVPQGSPLRCTPVPPCPPRCIPPQPALAVKYHHVTVSIANQIATTHVDQVFVNDAPVDLEGTYIFPLPADAVVSDFAMWVDGKRLEAQVLDKDSAKQIYTRIVNQRRDPALLEYIGRGAFQARVFPIPAHGEKRIELEYKQVLTGDGGLIRYVYPLNTEKFSARPLNDVSVSVSIQSKDALKAIYSPSHDVSITRNGEFSAVAGWEAKNVIPDRDFALYYSVAQAEIGINVLTFKAGPNEDGFFVLLAAPNVSARPDAVVARDVIFVLDVSGSMQGVKIEQAKQALTYVLGRLNPQDRFDIITFSTGVNKYASALRPASEKDEALPFVRAVRAEGSTDINRALLEALALADRTRPTLIVFLTDGQPTTGEVNPDKIVANAQDAAPKNVRLFTFGVGYDLNTNLLDLLAQNLRGASAYVKPNENIDEVVSAFYAKVATPVLADLTLDFGGLNVHDLYPAQLPDLFAGSQLVLAGRYGGAGTATIRLKGTVNGVAQTYTYEGVTFGAQGGDDSIARIWATRAIGYLLNQVRLHGPQKEIVDAIVALSVRYGIVTPYTSFLVDETERAMSEEGRGQISSQQQKALATAAPASGAPAVQQSQDTSRMGSTNSAPVPALPTARPGQPQAADASQIIRYVGDRTFVLHDGVWTDTLFDTGSMSTRKVAFESDEYWRLLDAQPELARYFALGVRVIALAGGTAYEVTDAPAPSQGTPVVQPVPTNTPVLPPPINTPTPGPATPMPGPTETRDGGAAGLILAGGVGIAILLLMAGVFILRRR